MNWTRIGSVALDVLREAWNSRAPTADPVIIIAHASSRIAGDITPLKRSRAAGDYILAVVRASFAAKMLDFCFDFRGDEVRNADRSRGLVIYVTDTRADITTLDALERIAMATRTAAAQTPWPAPALAAEKPKKKKKKLKRVRYGEGQSFFSSRIPVEKSRIQIQELLTKYGADKFGYLHDTATNVTQVQFRARDRLVRFTLELPKKEEFQEQVKCNKGSRALPDEMVKARYERALRARWRAIVTAVRSKLALIEYNISSFEDAFLAETVDPETGKTVGELVREGRILQQLPPARSEVRRALNGSAREVA